MSSGARTFFKSPVLAELKTPGEFDAAAEFVHPKQLDGHVRISADLGRQLEWLQGDLELGFSQLYLHNVNRDQEGFIEAFGEKVLPALSVEEEHP
jgi:coenzyme F420-dependent glucose-6-phosphate dehydrogenase